MASGPVRGVDDVNKAFQYASASMRKELPLFLRGAARPVERGAEVAAAEIGAGAEWSQMRIGGTRNVYMAPQARSTRILSRKRPKFGPRLLNRAMIPALNANRERVGKSVDELVARIVRRFNRG